MTRDNDEDAVLAGMRARQLADAVWLVRAALRDGTLPLEDLAPEAAAVVTAGRAWLAEAGGSTFVKGSLLGDLVEALLAPFDDETGGVS